MVKWLVAGALVLALSGCGSPTTPAETVEELLKPENRDQLVSILTYHVVPGRVLAEDVVGLTSAKTVQGDTIDIKVMKGNDGAVTGVMVDGAKVIKTDIIGLNGVIHVIDSVIMPQ